LHLQERRRPRLEQSVRRHVLVTGGGMAFAAGHLVVLPLEREGAGLVVERGGRLPRLLVVALLALGRELPPVLVEVAGVAAGGGAQEGRFLRKPVEQLAYGSVGDEGALVAVVAAHLGGGMPALERPPGLLVIETVAATLPLAHREVLAAVIGVTR